jgi:hypothetical protein
VPTHDEYAYGQVLSNQQVADLTALLHEADDD